MERNLLPLAVDITATVEPDAAWLTFVDPTGRQDAIHRNVRLAAVAAMRAMLPSARWNKDTSAWHIPGKTAVQRAEQWWRDYETTAARIYGCISVTETIEVRRDHLGFAARVAGRDLQGDTAFAVLDALAVAGHGGSPVVLPGSGRHRRWFDTTEGARRYSYAALHATIGGPVSPRYRPLFDALGGIAVVWADERRGRRSAGASRAAGQALSGLGSEPAIPPGSLWQNACHCWIFDDVYVGVWVKAHLLPGQYRCWLPSLLPALVLNPMLEDYTRRLQRNPRAAVGAQGNLAALLRLCATPAMNDLVNLLNPLH